MTTKTKSPPFTFGRAGMPVGAVLRFRHEDVFLYREGEIVKVAGKGLQVTCNGKADTLGDLTRKLLLKRDPHTNTNLQPIQKWRYNGRRLDDIYQEWKWKKRLGRG
ncbi:MAG: hypothetical protein OXC18_14795 [Desulfurellaceae bacterium]|nr:hypothetical protein [Desulfurellaceae bacterium]